MSKENKANEIEYEQRMERAFELMLYKHMLEQAEVNKQKRQQELLANQTNIDDAL